MSKAEIPFKMDWLAYAIGVMGDKPGAGENTVQAAARELGVTRQKIISVLERGAGKLVYSQVLDLANRAGISVSLLRVGPAPYQRQA
jgi:hypothetical protein